MISGRTRAVLLFVLVLAFGVLAAGGWMISREKPPVPDAILTEAGAVLARGQDIMDGQSHYLRRGGQHIGTIWGHGSYLAPDWSADFAHRMGLFLAARHLGLPAGRAAGYEQEDYESLDSVQKARVRALVTAEMKQNRYDAATGRLVFTAKQAEAFRHLTAYYTRLFREGSDAMGIHPGVVRTEEEGRILTSFFAWLSWAAVANRPGREHTYTSNWPYDPLVGNEPLPGALIWSIVSVILLILGIGVVLFIYLRYMHDDEYRARPVTELAEPRPTPSQKATLLFFLAAMALFVVQAVTGSLTGHFVLEGNRILGMPIGHVLPYAAVRTWHLQLAVFWIATCFLAAGLFIGPFVGREPAHQAKLNVVLFAAVVVVVVGTLAGTWLSVTGNMPGGDFYLGHQGYEYIELGRVWQVLLIAGMIIWLVLVGRAIAPALKGERDAAGLTHLLLYSSVTIPLFYMAGLLYGRGSHLADAEYWRWWVVHLWVEGFFEVFAAVVLAFILSRIRVVSGRFALKTVYMSIFLYLGSGVIGTFHHLYWSGTPVPIMALGAVFSALEVVPLTLLGFEAAQNLRAVERAGGEYPYRWPIYFFVAVAFWNMVGAGVFGFLINPPIVLYYAQGINTTPLHAHAALFGVYGFLALALMLFSVRHVVPRAAWSDRLLKWSFWTLNGGLAAMTVFSLAPAGFYQLYFAVKDGLWYARSPEIASGSVIKALAIARIGPDLVFMAGAALMLAFTVRAACVSLGRAVKKST